MLQYKRYLLLGPFMLIALTVVGGVFLSIQRSVYNSTIIEQTATTIECDGAGIVVASGKYPNTSPTKPHLLIHCGGQKMTLEEPETVIAFALAPKPKIKCRKHLLGIDNCVVE